MAILLLVSSTATTTNVNTDQFENRFPDGWSLFFSNTSHDRANPESHATSAGPNYGIPVASVDKSIDAVVQAESKQNASDVNSVHSNQPTGKRPASNSTEASNVKRYAARSEHQEAPQLVSQPTPQTAADQAGDKAERWSDWSDCSVACGIGVQTQRLESSEFSSIKYRVCKKQVSKALFNTFFLTRAWLSDWLDEQFFFGSVRQVC